MTEKKSRARGESAGGRKRSLGRAVKARTGGKEVRSARRKRGRAEKKFGARGESADGRKRSLERAAKAGADGDSVGERRGKREEKSE